MTLVSRKLLGFRRIGGNIRFQCILGRSFSTFNKTFNSQAVQVVGNQRSFPTSNSHRVPKTIKKYPKRSKRDSTDKTSRENILLLEINELLNEYTGLNLTFDSIRNIDGLIETFLHSWNRPNVELNDVDIIFQTSEGDGLAIVPKSAYTTEIMDKSLIDDKYTVVKVPKSIVGDKVKVKILRHYELYAEANLIKVLNSRSSDGNRKDELVICDKFSTCSGCQFQMINYEEQLKFKKSVIQRAYKLFFPKLFSTYNEDFGNIIESPMQYAYRTKLTPHYEISSNKNKDKNGNINIGFNHVNPTKLTIDVDYCPIASPAINRALPHVRANVQSKVKETQEDLNIKKRLSKGATLLLRDSIRINHLTGEHERVCLTKYNNIITEKIGDFVFQFPASEFFQNNNSILPHVLDYIRFQINKKQNSYKYIVDTYCGSGFFGISLSKDIPEDGKVFGIEVSKLSIEHAIHNAKLNGLSVPEKIQFIEGNANAIFTNKDFVNSGIIGDDSIVIIDPSRKGSNRKFMQQLLEFKPKLIIYVSCNVFTQARDLADFDDIQAEHNIRYKIQDIIGFDFFPQTKHVESIAILELEE
ncbi:uncharacterized protein AC631_00259 [Debaryomyces fabryi]|uniref:TRAM domain-containing protein n=1 Tax=Debaryomyces fabryi TaxID=58627 RepID=A0A0V1Q6T2_9ASCO|nr:uncharacterized protein AC631_00259 [Debaryomyces fabryi]KSA03989.1 hypothetical protein AC631_00259 [Debaryomyces fabryi]CUM53780.1 unnamed protein product [Debaryomyces fabryi]